MEHSKRQITLKMAVKENVLTTSYSQVISFEIWKTKMRNTLI